MLFHLDYDGNGNVWTGLTGLMSHRDEAGLLHIWISLTRFTLVEIFHVRKCSRIHQFWSIRIHRLLHWKGVWIPDRLHTTTTPGTFMMKWLTSCLLPRSRQRETKFRQKKSLGVGWDASRSPRFRLCSPEIRKKLRLFCRLTTINLFFQSQPARV